MDWLGWAEVIGGIAGAPFTGGATLALVGPGLAHVAADKAKGEMVDAATTAKQDFTKLYQGTRSDLADIYKGQQAQSAPYASLGAGAASLLGAGLGIPNIAPYPGANLGVSGPPLGSGGGFTSNPLQPPGSGMTSTASTDWRNPAAMLQNRGGTAVPRAGTLSSALGPSLQRQSSYGGAGLVTMQAPNGETAQVPMAQVPFFKARGAQVVSNG